ncbi:MAG: C39 family peptidase [Anaerolineaceae bacterium]|nr:C39 family peptidase [Anaerolineaceae bacterium]
MTGLLQRFQAFYPVNTQQIGRYFCIPASIINSLRILGIDQFPQNRIRDLWYMDQGKQVEASIDDQMKGASFDSVIKALSTDPGFADISCQIFSRPGDSNLLDLSKSRETLSFISDQITKEHPVIVSTWNLALDGSGNIFVDGYHMWLLLSISFQSNSFIFHDPWTDQISASPILETKSIQTKKGSIQLAGGLLGKITQSDYNCLALWRN